MAASKSPKALAASPDAVQGGFSTSDLELTKLHVDTRDLDPALHEARHKIQGLLEIRFCSN